MKQTTYKIADMNLWQGRVDAEEGPLARRWHQQVQSLTGPSAAGVALLGFCSDAGVRRNQGNPGAAMGPKALRTAAANLSWHGELPLYDGGDVFCHEDELELAQSLYAEQVARLLNSGHRVIGLGGGHEIAFGSFTGLMRHLQDRGSQPRVGIINFDAHLDLRRSARASSGTPFNQCALLCEQLGTPFHYTCIGVSRCHNTAALFDRAEQLNTRIVLDEQLNGWNPVPLFDALDQALAEVDVIYLTICLDVLPASLAPGVSAPAVRGMDMGLLEAALERIKASNKVMMADIAELNPARDHHSLTARVAARLLARLAG
ncbi:formimidoylglutamase [Oceanimonas doudoroffii]|uniref:Formimidoylglutamase n=1 Tax=Oceanimonas doudoroffii TaxID=84158 RepID=A0A233RDB1_9GAMM|nr:formimidoylglutamase [Oceanimonas doudoroffii]OXY81399.1 formimidoylglutamase [Oceanimonas doudoroffii]